MAKSTPERKIVDASRKTPTGQAAVCRAMDRAIRRGEADRARSLLRTTARAIRRRPRLAERLVQRALAAGDRQLALALADACRAPTATLRALHRLCRVDSRSVLATAGAAPDDQAATLRLAARQAIAGSPRAAESTLRKLSSRPEALMLRLALAAERSDDDTVRRLARRLGQAAEATAPDPIAAVMVDSLRPALRLSGEPPSPATVRVLAEELVAEERAIAPLAAALAREGGPDVHLLVAAVERALPSLAAPAAAAEAIAELVLRHGDPGAARHWAERALSSNPFSASAARLLHEANRRQFALQGRTAA
jgi:hypothetical protein